MLYARCPVCKEPLNDDVSRAVCKNGHSFDYAKEGYLYLLKPNDKNSKIPGDNKDMVSARKTFLDGGFYQPLADAIAQEINERRRQDITLIDAGIGTGFYSNAIAHSREYNDVFLGIDVSKFAVKIASKRNPSFECCVASVFDMPYGNSCADAVLSVFSPFAEKEFARVLKDDGVLIVACPAENHLIELRQALYENVRTVETPLKSDCFDVLCEKRLSFPFRLADAEHISALLCMTPYVYRATLSSVQKIKALTSLDLTADFKIYVLKKRFDNNV